MNRKYFLSTLLIVSTFIILANSTAFSQSASLEGVDFTAPQGWTRTAKDGVVIFTDMDKGTGRYCVLSIYGAVPSAGSPQKDFTNNWNELVVKPFKAAADPETETRTEDGWTAVAGGTQMESGGTKSAVIMTVYSGFGKSVALLAILNDSSYVETIDAFNRSLKIDKTVASKPLASDSEYLDFDPFPPGPNSYMVHKPLIGPLKRSITLADLAGYWSTGAGSVQTLVDSSTGNYAGTNTTFYGKQYVIRPNGSFEYRFDGRSGNRTVREVDTGSVSIEGGLVILKYMHGGTERFRFVAYMELPKGAAVLTLLQVGENPPPQDPAQLRLICSHLNGYISCANDTLLSRRPNKN